MVVHDGDDGTDLTRHEDDSLTWSSPELASAYASHDRPSQHQRKRSQPIEDSWSRAGSLKRQFEMFPCEDRGPQPICYGAGATQAVSNPGKIIP